MYHPGRPRLEGDVIFVVGKVVLFSICETFGFSIGAFLSMYAVLVYSP